MVRHEHGSRQIVRQLGRQAGHCVYTAGGKTYDYHIMTGH
jgi:hypothetical protein